MAATFRTRPWQLASARPSFSPSVCAARGFLANVEQTRQYGTRKRMDPRIRHSMASIKKGQGRQEVTSSMVTDMMDDKNHIDTADMAVLSPRTIVPLPPSRAPRDLKNFFTYYKEWLKQRLTDRLQIIQQTFQLKEKRWRRATFRAKRKGITEAALNMHAAMSYDLARGGPAEKMHLAQFCVPKLARSLTAAIESRPQGKRYEWERLRLSGWPFWPRLVDHKWTDVDVGFQQSFMQAVVGIKSKQRLTELDAKGKVVGAKEMELLEHVVLWRSVDKVNKTKGDWKLYGTLRETTLQDMLREGGMLKGVADKLAAKKLQETRTRLDRS